MLCENVYEQVFELFVRAAWVALGSAEYAAVCVVVGRIANYRKSWSVYVRHYENASRGWSGCRADLQRSRRVAVGIGEEQPAVADVVLLVEEDVVGQSVCAGRPGTEIARCTLPI